jgi:two-component system CheB/CheR fusion protein
MGPTANSLFVRYGMAVLAIGVALLVRQLLDPWLDNHLVLLPFSLAVVVVAWHGGFGPCLVSQLLGLLAGAYFFWAPRHDPATSLPRNPVLAGGFLFLGVAIGVFSEALRAARRRAEALARDSIRRQKELEEEIAGRKQLEQELQLRADELANADRRKDEFLAMLAHELRGPLAPISNAVQIIKSCDDDRATVEKARGMVERQVQHLSRIVDDLLDVSRVTKGKLTLRKAPVEVATVVARAIEMSRPLLDARGHELAVTLPREPLWVRADVTRLAQVVGNLLNNAAKYTAPRGHIRLSVEPAAGQVVVRVRDDGMGIPADLLPRVFDLFTQGENSLARSEGGLGIGLTVVKSLVEMHGGTVTAQSDGPGQGSEFEVRLPLLERKPAAAVAAAAGGPPVGRRAASRRVLVVDDNVDAAESLATVLRIAGHEVRTTHDGGAALTAAEAFRPQVVLLDIGLPQMDGYEVARRLRARPGLEKALLVAVTGYGQEEDRCRAEEAGFDAHLVKPADLAALHRLLAGSGANG